MVPIVREIALLQEQPQLAPHVVASVNAFPHFFGVDRTNQFSVLNDPEGVPHLEASQPNSEKVGVNFFPESAQT
jgi:hypothetical protein